MKISYNWLKEYVHIDLDAQQVSEILTDTGLEVETLEKIETIKGGLKGVVVGEVKTCEKHPDADKLSVTTVDVGGGKILPGLRCAMCRRPKGGCWPPLEQLCIPGKSLLKLRKPKSGARCPKG